MLTGKELGEAIRIAIQLKTDAGVMKKDIAAHFGVKQPSLTDWVKNGSIDKDKLPKLWKYFADVVPMQHWGLTPQDFACFGLVPDQHLAQDVVEYRSPRQAHIKRLIEATDDLDDAGLDQLITYARFLAADPPRAKANALK